MTVSRQLIDPELRPYADLLPQEAMTAETLPAYRQMLLDMVARLPGPDAESLSRVTSERRLVPGGDGAPDVPVLVYRPVGAAGPLPAFLHIHGGGFVSGTAAMGEASCRLNAIALGCVLVSVDYRLAPETAYPGPLEDCYAALLWLHGACDELGVDRDRIAIGGESAGAGLAAALCLLARDRGAVKPCLQYLAEPMLDHRSPDTDHPHVGMVGWTPAHSRFGWQSMLRTIEAGAEVPAYASPACAVDLSGLPPTYVSIGAVDLFLEEAVDYARRLTRAGVAVELHVWPGAFHAFQAIDCHVSRQARAASRAALGRALHPPRDLVGEPAP